MSSVADKPKTEKSKPSMLDLIRKVHARSLDGGD